MRPQGGVRGRPGMGRQRMGRPGMRGRPGIERQRFGGPEYFESPSIPDLHESDVSPESLADFPTNVRVVGVDEFDQTSFDELVPLVVKGAAARASKKWTDEWLLQRFGSVDCGVNLDSRTGDKQFRKHMTLAKYLATLAKSKTSHQPLEYLYQPRMEQEFGGTDILEDLDVPAAILGLGEDTSWWLTVGPTLSGTLPHYHRTAMNVLARGRKRWAIYVGANLPDNNGLKNESWRDYGIGTQAKDWFVRECPQLRSRRRVQLWEFAQEAGDLVYIPSFFVHAVVNLEPVVGFSVMFYQPKDRAALAEHRWRRSSEGVAGTSPPIPGSR